MASCMLCRNGNYYFRIRVPKSAVDLFHRREIVISLKTRDRSQALLRCAEKIVEHRYVFSYQENRQVAHMSNKDLLSRISGFEICETEDTNGKKTRAWRVLPEVIREMKEAKVPGARIGAITEKFILLAAEDIARTSNSIAVPPVATSNPVDQATPITVKELVEIYISHLCDIYRDRKKSKLDLKTKLPVHVPWYPERAYKIKFRRFREIFGDDFLVRDISHSHAKEVRRLLSALPASPGKTRNFTVKDAVSYMQLSADKSHKKITNKTINEHIALYKAMLSFAASENYYSSSAKNPFDGFGLTTSRRSSKSPKRSGFSSELSKEDLNEDSELARIFRHDIFCRYKTGALMPGREKVFMQPSDYWVPLIALYTGARPCEIGALHAKDIRTVFGIHVFDFNDSDPGKCSKSFNAIRLTPIHSHLINLGFLAYVEQIRKSGQARLFPEVQYEDEKGFGNTTAQRFVENVLDYLDLYKKDTKVFYSFRHSLKTSLGLAGIADSLSERISGREDGKKSVGREFYEDQPTLRALRDAIEKLDFGKELEQIKAWE